MVGPAIAGIGFALFAVPGIGGSYWTTFFPAAVVLGIGLAAQAPAVTTVALNSVDVRHSGLASAINNAFSQTAALLAIAVLGVLMFSVFGAGLDSRLEVLDLSPAARQQLEQEKIKLGAAEIPEGLDAAPAVERAIDEAFVAGYRAVMLVAAGTALASALSAALLIEGKKPKEKTEEEAYEEAHEDAQEYVLVGLESQRALRPRRVRGLDGSSNAQVAGVRADRASRVRDRSSRDRLAAAKRGG